MSTRLLLCFILCLNLLISITAYAQRFDQQAGLWTETYFYGHFFSDKFKYHTELDLRFKSDDPIFDQAVVRLSLGYVVNPDISLWLGYDFTPDYNVFVEKLEYEQRVWQQLLVHLINHPRFKFDLRTRLEQRDDLDEGRVAWQLRQMLSVTFPSEIRGKITPFFADEIFFNLNHPVWISEDTVSQNRIFIGILIPWKSDASFRVSYLNQILIGRQVKIMRHIIYVSLNLKHDLL